MLRLLTISVLSALTLLFVASSVFSVPAQITFTATAQYPSCTVTANPPPTLFVGEHRLAGTDAISGAIDWPIITLTCPTGAGETSVPNMTPAVSITPTPDNFTVGSCLLGSDTATPTATPNQGIILGEKGVTAATLSLSNCITFTADIDNPASAASYYWDVGAQSGDVTDNTVTIALAVAKQGSGSASIASYTVPIDFDFTYH